MKPGSDDRVLEILEQLRSIEQPDSGLVRTTAMIDQKDRSQLHLLVVFESEDHARAREADPRRAEGLEVVRGMMGEIFDGPPEFVDLVVLDESPA
jgi:hypothetical protein